MAYMTLPVYNIDEVVGHGPDRPDDVRLVQELLNAVARRRGGWQPPTPLSVDGMYTDNLGAYIQDGKVNPLHMRSAEEWDGRFGQRVVGVRYTLRSWEEDSQDHFQLGLRMNRRHGLMH